MGDGIDQDCDRQELCYEDTDGDRYGETHTIPSADVDCDDAGEAANPDDVCVGGDDDDDDGDGDGDGNPDFCDPRPVDNPDDTDADAVCDSDDICPTGDDTVDTEGDGVPNAWDDSDGEVDSDGDGFSDDCDTCPGFDDNLDRDEDEAPDGCDACPGDNPNDTDNDELGDGDDPCPEDFTNSCDPTDPHQREPLPPGVVEDGVAGCGCAGAATIDTAWVRLWVRRRNAVCAQGR